MKLPSPRPSPIRQERQNRLPSLQKIRRGDCRTAREKLDYFDRCSLSHRMGEGQGEGRFAN
jgi:hypothetical protein